QETASGIDPKAKVSNMQQFKTSDEHILSFDLLLPDTDNHSDTKIREHYREISKKSYPDFTLIITIQRAYQVSSKEPVPGKNSDLPDDNSASDK
ncbi:MAG: hypothetical protein GX777_10470, partial [Fastidiosipila sp.]|nr:hypothetical protein [Fastidiosipila sp.]